MRIVMGLAVAATLWTTPALATDWYMVATTADKTSAALVDRDSIANADGNVRRVTTMQVFKVDQQDAIAAMQAQMEYDCSGSRYRYLTITAFRVTGDKVGVQAGSGKWYTVGAGAVNEMQLKFICADGTATEGTADLGGGLPIASARARLSAIKPDV